MEELNRNTEQRPWPPVRRRKRRPKWQRVLRKYWPPIRFGLICLLLLVLLISGVRGVVGLIRDAVNRYSCRNSTKEESMMSMVALLLPAPRRAPPQTWLKQHST